MWRPEFEALREEGGCFVLTNHPSSRAAVASAGLEGLIEYVRSHADVWVASMSAIANHVRGHALTPRSVERPNPADF